MEIFGLDSGWWNLILAIVVFIIGRTSGKRGERKANSEYISLLSKLIDKVPDRATAVSEMKPIPDLDRAVKSTDKRIEAHLPVETSILVRLGTAEYHAGNLRKARGYWVRALDQAAKSGDFHGAKILGINLGLVNYFIGDLELAEGYLNASESVIAQLNILHRENEAHIMANKALVYSARGKHDEAIVLHERAMSIFDDLGEYRLVAQQYANIGRVYLICNEYQLALDNTRKAIEIAEREGSEISVASSFITVALIHCELGNEEEAEAALARAELAAKTAGKSDLLAHLDSLKGRVAKLKGKYDESISYHQKSLALFQENGNSEKVAEQLGNIGWCYKLIGDFDKAREYLQQSHASFEKMGFVDGLDITASLLEEIETEQQNKK